METTKTISKQTGSIISALEALYTATEKTLEAYLALYGDSFEEGGGDSKYNSSGLRYHYEQIKGTLYSLLSESIEGNLEKLSNTEI